MRVGIIGQGYVGSALAIAADSAGHQVIGIESDQRRLKELNQLVRYQVSGDYSAVTGSEIIVIAVPTPLNDLGQPELSYLTSACQSLAKVLNGPTLIINESTSYPGTLRNLIAPILGQSHLYAAAPERIDPANKVWGIENTPRLIAGLNDEARDKALEFYKSFTKEVISIATVEVAETAKLFENTFRQVNIALVNEFAQIANALGVSSSEVLSAAATKPYGFMPFLPSIGVGGHCIPVDPTYLSYAASQVGVEASFINLANQVNAAMPDYIAARIQVQLGSLIGKSIQIAGISYKADVSDIRQSPAILLIEKLREMGAEVSWHDQVVGQWAAESSSALKNVDLGVIAIAHSGVDYGAWRNSKTMVIDLSTSPNTGWAKFL
jgi:UDP-N-acetyl-D-glucosamine dehydrogenase